ncbi:hypothetical protein Taro_006079 [Colocasia esculenta]|uniref:Uncharacterized protein n=1 Tax=Colocasia esculenta TaxID=4460 RepID=A0A843TRI1_COLES|nr:hypothetical protein [Colocasia esculenta]
MRYKLDYHFGLLAKGFDLTDHDDLLANV